jgi:transcriptional regulator with XRE-family HTH domain
VSARRGRADCTTIGGRLKAERLRLNKSQGELADLAGLSDTTLGTWEAGRSYPNAKALAALARCGVDLSYVVIGERSLPPSTGIRPLQLRYLIGMLPSPARRDLLISLVKDELQR